MSNWLLWGRGLSVPAPVFSPLDVLDAYWDFSQATVDSNYRVLSLTDQGANQYALTPPSTSAAPTQMTYQGYTVGYFDGADDYLLGNLATHLCPDSTGSMFVQFVATSNNADCRVLWSNFGHPGIVNQYYSHNFECVCVASSGDGGGIEVPLNTVVTFLSTWVGSTVSNYLSTGGTSSYSMRSPYPNSDGTYPVVNMTDMNQVVMAYTGNAPMYIVRAGISNNVLTTEQIAQIMTYCGSTL